MIKELMYGHLGMYTLLYILDIGTFFFLLFYFRYYLLRVTALELITGRSVYNDYGEDDFNNPEFWKDVLGRKFETKIEELNISDAGKSSTEY